MKKLSVGIQCFSIIAMQLIHGFAEGPKTIEEWLENVSHAKQKVTKLHFYFHDLIYGKTMNPTADLVARSNMTATSPTFFGTIYMMDDPMTVGAELSSKQIGYARGMYATDAKEELGLLTATTFIFTDGEYNGSSVVVLGHNPLLHHYREMPIVGGTGKFRMARGVATYQTYYFNFTAGNITIEVNVAALHY